MTRDMWTRRALMTGIGAAVAALGLRSAPAHAQTPASRFRPARHEQDDWLDQMPGHHRVFIDSATAKGASDAVLYANNLYRANNSAYSIDASDLAIVVCFRHFATVFGYNDAMWAKYGEHLSSIADFTDPETGTHASANPYGDRISTQIERGAHFAICDMATRSFAGRVARATGGARDDIYEELVANAIPNSRFVSAGVVATTRSQEYGYSLLYAG